MADSRVRQQTAPFRLPSLTKRHSAMDRSVFLALRRRHAAPGASPACGSDSRRCCETPLPASIPGCGF